MKDVVDPLVLAESNLKTSQHIMEVGRNLNFFVKEILDRADVHDASKLEGEEVMDFARVTHKLEGMTYGSEEYDASRKELGPALEHHYANNRHHPEHFKRGVRDMNLVDLVEMFCDWLASSKRHNNGNIRKSIEKNSERFSMGPELTAIFERTADLFDKTRG